MAIGLHILYGVMGSGKTNFAVNELLTKRPINMLYVMSIDRRLQKGIDGTGHKP